MTRYEGLERKRHWKDPDLWLKTWVNDGATHQGTEYRTGCEGVGQVDNEGEKLVLWDILSGVTASL